MKTYDMPQGSRRWLDARLGIPTASCFNKLITPSTMKPSKSARGYLHQLLAETMVGHSVTEDLEFDGMVRRGGKLEQQAVNRYEFERDVDCETIGFCTTDDGLVGCSPDRLVGEDGLLEVKAPSAKVFVGLMLDGVGHDYRCQIQGQMWVTGRQWCDLLIYNPVSSPIIQRYEVEPKWVEAFEPVIAQFTADLVAGRARLEGLTGDLENS